MAKVQTLSYEAALNTLADQIAKGDCAATRLCIADAQLNYERAKGLRDENWLKMSHDDKLFIRKMAGI